MSEFVIKVLGSVFIILASAYYGYSKIRLARLKIEEISAFGEMVKYVHDNIEHFSKPLPEIFAEYGNSYFENVGLLCKIRQQRLREALETYTFRINDSERELMLRFANKLGSGYREDEMSLCKYTQSKLTATEEIMRAELKNIEKLYRSIPLMLALSVILILI